MVGNEGVPLSLAIVFACLLFNTISLLAAIGIMERCAAVTAAQTSGLTPFKQFNNQAISSQQQQRFDPEYTRSVATARANVHILVATVLGSRIGGAISLVYCIGQAVSCALHVTGFSEAFVQLCAIFIRRQLMMSSNEFMPSLSPSTPSSSLLTSSNISIIEQPSLARTIARLLRIDILEQQQKQSSSSGTSNTQLILNPESFQIVSIILIFILFFINIVGVRWLFRLQTLLFLALVAAVGDFSTGLFHEHADYGNYFLKNLLSIYDKKNPSQSNRIWPN